MQLKGGIIMDQQLVIKLTAGDGTGVPVGLIESPPVLYTNFKTLFPSVTFSDIATSTETEPYWYGVFEWAYPPENLEYTKSFDDVGVTKHEDGVWRNTFVMRNATAEEIENKTKYKAEQERHRRYILLRRAEWTQMPDNNLSVVEKQAWAEYRQKLRDVPQQLGFPWVIDWPVPPT